MVHCGVERCHRGLHILTCICATKYEFENPEEGERKKQWKTPRHRVSSIIFLLLETFFEFMKLIGITMHEEQILNKASCLKQSKS